MKSEVTICITTFLRPKVLHECINCITKYYPNSKIIVAEQPPVDSKYSDRIFNNNNKQVKVLTLPFDCGASFARNRLTEAVDTKFSVIMDDDMFFKNENLNSLLNFLKETDLDICGGMLTDSNGLIQRWDGIFWIENNCLHVEPIEIYYPYVILDLIPNFFIAKTNSLLKVKWCEEYKIGREHIDFFWHVKQVGLKVGLSPLIIADHIHYRDTEYNFFRFRGTVNLYNELLLKRLKVNCIKSSTYHNLNIERK